MADSRTTIIIGAGAAGCFCAIELKRRRTQDKVIVLEAGAKALAKVAVTGGGRCNLTNTFAAVDKLRDVYPRGDQLMKRAFRQFGPEDTVRWFEKEGVRLTAQADNCIFPVSQDAMQIVRTLENLMRRLGVDLRLNTRVVRIGEAAGSTVAKGGGAGEVGSSPGERTDRWTVCTADGQELPADSVVVTTGGATLNGLVSMFPNLELEFETPVPSLFTFKIPDDGLRALMGTVVDNVTLALAGTPFRSQGTLLVTDWGVSGPATLRLSSYAARYLADSQYRATLVVNWADCGEEEVRAALKGLSGSSRFVANTPFPGLTDRLWKALTARACLRPECRWSELGSKGLNRLVSVLTADGYPIEGRARFKEEFVTCGGISLRNIDTASLENRRHPGLFFAGEVLDIDAVTGGFNLQAAWTTGWCAACGVNR